MSKNTQIGELINYISVNESGDVVLSNGHLVATQNYVSTAVANLVDAAPTTLDTLNELAAALGDDPNFATTVTNSIGGKLSLTGGTLNGALNGTSAVFSSTITASSTGGSGLRVYGGSGTNQWDMYLNGANIRFSDNTGTGSFVVDRPATFSSSVTAGNELSILGGDGGGKKLYFTGGTTKYNFMIAAQQNVNNALEITPSTAAGGSTFSTPALTISSTGAATITTTDNQGGLLVTSATDNTTIRVASTATGGQEWRLQSTGGTSGLGQGKLIFKVGTTETASYIPLTLTTDNSTNGGRVGIGTTSPAERLDILGPNGSGATIRWRNEGGRKSGYLYSDSAGVAIYDTNLNDAGIYLAQNTQIDFRVNGSQKMVINSDGVAIGHTGNDYGRLDVTVSPSTYSAALALGVRTNSAEGNSTGISFKTKVSLSGAIWENARIAAITESVTSSAYGALVFYTMNATTLSERMRISPGGVVQVTNAGSLTNSVVLTPSMSSITSGTTAVVQINQSFAMQMDTISGTQYGILGGNSALGGIFFRTYSGSYANRFLFYSDGTAYNSTGTWGNFSDIRLKQDIVDANSQWDDIKSLKFKKYRLKKDVQTELNSTNGFIAPTHFGLIAQDVEQTSPGLIEEVDSEDGGTTKMIKTSIMLMKSVKALQEVIIKVEEQQEQIEILKAENDTLKSRIDTLEQA